MFKTRRGNLKSNLEYKLLNKKIGSSEIDLILTMVDAYEKDNLDTIDKLKREKKIELNRINGALRQTIDAHGDITKILIGSASKRIYGALLVNNTKQNFITKLFNALKFK
jgi:hypothetical protein